MGMAAFAYASYNNYPGGVALWKLHQQESTLVSNSYSTHNPALVHIDVAAAQQVCSVVARQNVTFSRCFSRAFLVFGNLISSRTITGAIPNKKTCQSFPPFIIASAKLRRFPDFLSLQLRTVSTP
jgi:hypothetical protein